MDGTGKDICSAKAINASQKCGRNGLIELLRFIFAFSLVSRHAGRLPDAGHIFLYGGHVAFEFFFILTGFFLYEHSRRMDNGEIPVQENAFLEAFGRCKRYYGYLLIPWVISFTIKAFADWKMLFVTLQKSIPQLFLLSSAGLDGQALGVNDYNEQFWYTSAMFLVILFLWPAIRRGKIYFAAAIAPVFAFLRYGYNFITWQSIGPVMEWGGFWYVAIPRALAGICLGCFCNVLAHAAPSHRLSKAGDAAVSLIQICLLLLILFNMEYRAGSTDVIQIVYFFLLILITLSEETTLNRIFDCKLSAFLGKTSVIIFATHSLASVQISGFLPYPEQWSWRYRTYLLYVVLFSLLNYLMMENIRRRHIIQSLKHFFWETNK